MKTITACGSLEFRDGIMKITEEMALQENCVLSIVHPMNSDIAVYTGREGELLGNMYEERICISDAILVVDIDHYIGSSTQGGTEFARALGKEIIYYTDIVGTME